jgi:hypothetical protein
MHDSLGAARLSMDCCFRSGELIVMPREGGADSLRAAVRQRTDRELEVIYNVEQVLDHYRRAEDWHLPQKREPVTFRAFPFVMRVPQGEELQFAQLYQEIPEVAVAVPNFHVEPAQLPIDLNREVIDDAIAQTLAIPPTSACGSGVCVAVLDTGIDLTAAPWIGLDSRQYDTHRPRDPATGFVPYDNDGHGTVVASLISGVAPGARVVSVKVMDSAGNLMGVVAGLYVTESEVRPDIYNLSLGVRCDIERCQHCKKTTRTPHLVWQVGQLLSSFAKHSLPDRQEPLLIAAAGNGTGDLMVPASLPPVLAVGALDRRLGKAPSFSRYGRIPPDRFIVAPGASDSDATCFAMRSRGEFGPRRFFGTSFSTALVSGLAARYMCKICGLGFTGRSAVWECLNQSADRSFPGYRRDEHGFGFARYAPEVAAAVARGLGGRANRRHSFSALPAAYTLAEVEDAVRSRAYTIWEQRGRPSNGAAENWLAAKRELEVPEELEI